MQRKNPDSLSKLPIGSVIKCVFNEREIQLVKHPAAYQFKRPFWMIVGEQKYLSPKNIPNNYEIIKRGE